MIWFLAGAALSAVQGLGAARAEREQIKLNNKAAEKFNAQVATQAAKSFNDIAVQKVVLADQTEEGLAAIQRQGLQLKSDRGLQAAATDTMGRSVEQALLDADYQQGQAASALLYNTKISELELNSAAQAVADSSGMSMRTQQAVPNAWSATLGKVVGQVGSQLLANKANTGSFMGGNSAASAGAGTSLMQGLG